GAFDPPHVLREWLQRRDRPLRRRIGGDEKGGDHRRGRTQPETADDAAHRYTSVKLADPDVAEGGLVAMVLNTDASLCRPRIARMILELALRDELLPFRTVDLVFDQLHAIQPVLHVLAVRDDAGRVPFARRLR